jgi:hypothetical protein
MMEIFVKEGFVVSCFVLPAGPTTTGRIRALYPGAESILRVPASASFAVAGLIAVTFDVAVSNHIL